MSDENIALWLVGKGQEPKIGPAPTPEPGPGELLLRVRLSLPLQSFFAHSQL